MYNDRVDRQYPYGYGAKVGGKICAHPTKQRCVQGRKADGSGSKQIAPHFWAKAEYILSCREAHEQMLSAA
jgi:hypothetical protein